MQRRQVKHRFNVDSAGLEWAKADTGNNKASLLGIQGIPCTVFPDIGFRPEEHLISLHGDEDSAADRFDGRLLLEDLRAISESLLPPAEAIQFTAQELEEERYSDLDYSREDQLASIAGWFTPSQDLDETQEAREETEDPTNSSPNADGHESLSAVGYSYLPAEAHNEADQQQGRRNTKALHDETEDEQFTPTFKYPVGLVIPRTQRMHKIIVTAAKFVKNAGKQSVFVLRVKHAGNPHFSFLMPEDPLNPYFEWLLSTDKVVKAVSKDEEGSVGENFQDSALGLLSSYGGEASESPTASSEALKPLIPTAAAPEKEPLSSSEQALPPTEIQAIIEKLVQFVERGGQKFEASARAREKDNPRFAFLQPDHKYHWFYREKLTTVLGKEKAELVLPTQPPQPFWSTKSKTSLQQRPEVRAPVAKEGPIQHSKHDVHNTTPIGRVRANPGLVKVAYRPLPEPIASDSAGKRKRVEAEGRDAGGGSVAASGFPARKQPLERLSAPYDEEGSPSQQPGASRPSSLHVVDSDADFLRSTSGPAREQQQQQQQGAGPREPRPEPSRRAEGTPDTAANEDDRKAQRRRLARLLLQQKKAGHAAKVTTPSSAKTQSFRHHRSMLLAEEGDGNTDEGLKTSEGFSEDRQHAAGPAPQTQLPNLDDLLKSRRTQPIETLSNYEVMASGSHQQGGPSAKTRRRKKRRWDSKDRRDHSHSSPSDSSSSETHRQRPKPGTDEHRRHRKDSRAPRPREIGLIEENKDTSEDIGERVRALLRAQR